MSSPTQRSPQNDSALALRPASLVMSLPRLGCLHPFRLSFMRTLVRHMAAESWCFRQARCELDANGYGTAIYEIETPRSIFSFVVFAHALDPDLRTDRVIANQWDMTVTLCAGRVTDSQFAMLSRNVPLQEGGRVDNRSIVLSRANKSVRNFEYVVGELAAGRQPAADRIARVGYLYRTTAVYGSGKFGMADWANVAAQHPDLARPFTAEMLCCYLIREFSLDQAEYLARQRAPDSAVPLDRDIKRYFGIGNATGLGMAPFLINHPYLIGRWMLARETALARVFQVSAPSAITTARLVDLIHKARRHLQEISTGNEEQDAQNRRVATQLTSAAQWVHDNDIDDWRVLSGHADAVWHPETQEILHSLLMELYPELVDDLEHQMTADEECALDATQRLDELLRIVDTHYAWALAIDFAAASSRGVFWYRSKEKMEPRLGDSLLDDGSDKAMAVDIAYQVRKFYDTAVREIDRLPDLLVAEFAIAHPEFRNIMRRIQWLAACPYGDVQANLIDSDVLPIHLLRCKLSFFGVSKFDPKSRLWVRNTMFQGAPLRDELDTADSDSWFFPVMPNGDNAGIGCGDVN